MYVRQLTPDETSTFENGEDFTPLVTLKDEHGGVLQILIDDHCYVVAVKKEEGFRMTPWLNTEVVEVLRKLPPPTMGDLTISYLKCDCGVELFLNTGGRFWCPGCGANGTHACTKVI